MQQNQNVKTFKNWVFSPFLLEKTTAKKIAYTAVVTAFLLVCNTFLEVKFTDVQFSFTITASIIAGVILGPLNGFLSCFIADGLGFLINSWGLTYMPWVGLTTAVTAFISGSVTYLINFKFKGAIFVKLTIICILSFFIGTVLINSTGFYYYNYLMGFSTAVIDYVKSVFGGEVTFIGYVFYRLIFKGQIINCLVNYALAFIIIPILIRLNIFKKSLEKVE